MSLRSTRQVTAMSADGIAGIVTVPFGGTTNSFNGGEGSQCIGSVGVGFSY